MADVHVAKLSDFGKNDVTLIARSHLGNVLNPGDLVYGYDLQTSNFNDDNFSRVAGTRSLDVPDVVLVKKSYSEARKKPKSRVWKLKNLNKEAEEEAENRKRQEATKMEQDYELFLRDLEEDEEMRQAIQIYKDEDALQRARNKMSDAEDNDDAPEIPLEELLDDLTLNEDVEMQ